MSSPQWNPYKTYREGDVVMYGGVTYRALMIHRGVAPGDHVRWAATAAPTSVGDPLMMARIVEFLQIIDESIYFEGYGGFSQS